MERSFIKRMLNFCPIKSLYSCCGVSKLWHTTALACAFAKERSVFSRLPSYTTGATDSILLELRRCLASKMIDETIEEWIPAVRLHTHITARTKHSAIGDRCLHSSLLVASVTAPSQTKLQRAVLIRCAHAAHYDPVQNHVRNDCAALITRISLDSHELSHKPPGDRFKGVVIRPSNVITTCQNTSLKLVPQLRPPKPACIRRQELGIESTATADVDVELGQLSARVAADLAEIKSLDLEFRDREGVIA